MGSRDGTAVRVLTSHQCVQGSIIIIIIIINISINIIITIITIIVIIIIILILSGLVVLHLYSGFIKSILKSLVILAMWLALSSAIYSQITHLLLQVASFSQPMRMGQ